VTDDRIEDFDSSNNTSHTESLVTFTSDTSSVNCSYSYNALYQKRPSKKSSQTSSSNQLKTNEV